MTPKPGKLKSINEPERVIAHCFAGFKVIETDGPALIQSIEQAVLMGERKVVLYLNPHIFNLASMDPTLKSHLDSADIVLVDGIGLVIASRFLGCKIKARLTLMDYIAPLLRTAAKNGWAVYFLGGDADTVARLPGNMVNSFPGLKVAGCRDGYCFDGPADDLVADINFREPVLLFAGLGTPLQERWLIENRDRLNVKIFIAAGGSFSNLAGKIKRAPEWMHKNGLEWAYRAIQEPVRLGPRYVFGGASFALRILKAALAD